MSFKRARAEYESRGYATADLETQEKQAELQKAGANFRRFLIEKYTEGSFTARDTCLLAFLHSEAGGCGAEDLGLRPETAGRHGAEHLRPFDEGVGESLPIHELYSWLRFPKRFVLGPGKLPLPAMIPKTTGATFEKNSLNQIFNGFQCPCSASARSEGQQYSTPSGWPQV